MPDINLNDHILDNKTLEELPVSFSRPPTLWDKILNNKGPIIASVIFLMVVVGILWYFLGNQNADKPTSTNVLLFVKGPTELTSGNEGEYHIQYRNGENAQAIPNL